MSKISFLIYFICLSSFASLSEGIQLFAKGELVKGTRTLEKLFEQGSLSDQAKASLILSRVKNVKMENAPHYYAKYALKFLSKYLNSDEKVILNSELGQYQLSLGNLEISKKYYLNALKVAENNEQIEFLNNRLGWVAFNNANYKEALKYLDKTLETTNQKLRDDSLYLLGKSTALSNTNLKKYQGKKILSEPQFISGINEAVEFIENKEVVGNFSKFYYSVHGKLKNVCEEDFTKLPIELEIENSLLITYLKKCLISHQSVAKDVQKLITHSKLENELISVLALSFYIAGESEKSCSLYKEGYKTNKNLYTGLISACPVLMLNLQEIGAVKKSCDDQSLFNDLNSLSLDKLSVLENIENKSFLYQALELNINDPHFETYLGKLGDCTKSNHLRVKKALNDEDYFQKLAYKNISTTCDNYTQESLEFVHLKYLYGEDISDSDKNCLKKQSNYHNQLLSKIEFSKVKKRDCFFSFDCEVMSMSGYYNEGLKLKTNSKVRKYFYQKINQLISLKDRVKKVSMNSLESFYQKITRVKKIFNNPKVSNVSFMHKVVHEYNSTIDLLMASLDDLKGLELSQKNLLKSALSAEKVVL